MHRTVAVGVITASAVALLLGIWLSLGFPQAHAWAADGSETAEAVLRVGATSDPDSLNPFVGSETACYEIWCLNYDQLVGVDPETLEPSSRGGLARSWEFSSDCRTCTFHLRRGVKWQDGRPFTADDVAFTYNYIIRNKMASFSQATAGIDEAVAIDAYTVRIDCSEPKADLLSIWIPILPKHVWEKVPPAKAATDFVKTPLIGTGPFQCVAYKENGYVRMVVNRDYWRGAPAVDEVIFQTYQNADTMISDLKAGNIDAAQGVPRAQFDSINESRGLEAITYSYRNWNYLCFNCYTGTESRGNPVLRDVRFRTALNWAVDRQKLADIAWGGFADPGTTILPPNNWLNPDYHWQPSEDMAYGYDPGKAALLLDRAGYGDTDDDGIREYRGKPIVLGLMAGTDSVEEQGEAKLIVSDLKKVGVACRYQVVDPGVISDRVYNYDGDAYAPDFDMCVWAWDGYSDPGQTLACFTTAQIGGWNEEGWSNAEYDRLCDLQRTATDLDRRKRIIWRMQEIMYGQSPEIVVTYPKYVQAYNTARWTGWTRMPAGAGPAFFVGAPDTYLNLRPIAADDPGSAFGTRAAAILALAAVATAVAALLLRRRHGMSLEEDGVENTP